VPVSLASALESELALLTVRLSSEVAGVEALAVGPPPLARPLYVTRIAAGFPSPADDAVEGRLDLNQYLIKHPAATFFVRVAGDSMRNAGIQPGDILVVDRALEPVDGRIVIAAVDGELTVKRLRRRDGQVHLVAENEAYAPLVLTEAMEVRIWGVVTGVIRTL
jgi:DNA polymerase V